MADDQDAGQGSGMGEYIGHFFKFLATFLLIIGLSLFLFHFTAGASAAEAQSAF